MSGYDLIVTIALGSLVAAVPLSTEITVTDGVTAILTLAVVVVSGAAQWAFDADEFPSLWDGVWWSVVGFTCCARADVPDQAGPIRAEVREGVVQGVRLS